MKRCILTLTLMLAGLTAHGQLDRSIRPQAAEARLPSIAEYSQFKLRNGLTVLVVENHKLPRVSMRLSIMPGQLFEGDLAGVTELTGSLLSEGTKIHSKANLDEQVDFIGANLGTSATSVSLSGLSKYTSQLFDVLHEVALKPLFDADAFVKLQNQMLTGMKSQDDDPGAIQSKVYGATLYGKDHPYGEFATEASIQRVTVKDCEDFYSTYWKPNVAVLTVVGDVSKAEIEAYADKHFKGWKGKFKKEKTYTNPTLPTQPSIVLVNRDASVQSNIKMGHVIELTIGDADLEAVAVMNQVLGAGSASRLFNNLREDKAYTYGAYSSYGTSKHVSSINASAEVRNEVTDSSVVEFLIEIDRMRSEIVGEEELQNAKNFLAGAFGRSLENPGTVSSFAFNNMYFDLDADYYNGYLKRLSAVTADDVMRVAKTYLSAEALTVVIVGKASEIAQPLERLGLPIRYVTSQAEATTAPIVRKAEGMTAADVMGNYYTAIGGKSAIDALATFQMESEAKIMGMSIKSKTVYIAPGKYYEKQQSPQGTNETIVVDGQVKVVSSGNETPLDAEATAAVIQESVWLPELLWTTGEDGNVQLQADLQDVEGNPCYVLVVTDADDNLIKVFYNQATGLKVRESRVVPGPEGDMVLNMEISDYRDVNGIMMPHLTTMPVGPGMVLEFKTKVAIVNGEVDASVFE